MPIDTPGFSRPRLQNCPSKHYDHQAGKALPAVVLGIIGRVGQVGKQRLRLPLGLLRVDPAQPQEAGLIQALITFAKELLKPQAVLVSAGGFALAAILSAKIPRYVAKQARNMTARREQPPEYAGTGRPRGAPWCGPWRAPIKTIRWRPRHPTAPQSGPKMPSRSARSSGTNWS